MKRNILKWNFITAAVMVIFSLFTVTGTTLAAPADSGESSWQGTASGSFSVNGKTVKLKYAYTMEEQDSFNEKETVISVLLTSDPLPKEAFKTDSINFAMDKSKPCILYTIDKTGKTISEVIIHSAIKSGGTQLSGITSGKMNIKKQTKQNVEGTITVKEPKPFFLDFEYVAQVSFNAPLMQPEKKAASLNEATGKRLPEDGGEPGKTFLAFISAVRSNDLKTIRKMAPDNIKKATDEELGQMIAILNFAFPKDIKIVKGFINDTSASLYVTGSGEEGTEFGIIDMANKNGVWIVDNQKWSNKAFDEK